MKNNDIELEARFLEINYKEILNKLRKVEAKDLGIDLMEEVIFYDKDLRWREKGIFVRLRKTNGKVYLTYKHHKKATVDGTLEIELEVDNFSNAKKFLLQTGLISYRQQQKKRHKFLLGNVFIDIDTWPKIPTYIEIEGKSEKEIKVVVEKLQLDYSKAVFMDAREIIEKIYKIPVSKYKYFTFRKIG